MTTLLSIHNDYLRVMMNNQITQVARYEDEGGIYFLNHNLEKQYAVVEEAVDVKEEIEVEEKFKKSFEFFVEYWQGDQVRTKFSTVEALDLPEAIKKVKKNFKRICTFEQC